MEAEAVFTSEKEAEAEAFLKLTALTSLVEINLCILYISLGRKIDFWVQCPKFGQSYWKGIRH